MSVTPTTERLPVPGTPAAARLPTERERPAKLSAQMRARQWNKA